MILAQVIEYLIQIEHPLVFLLFQADIIQIIFILITL